MDNNKVNKIMNITNDIHDEVNKLYESVVDEDGDEIKIIDKLITKLKTFKNNLIKKDEI